MKQMIRKSLVLVAVLVAVAMPASAQQKIGSVDVKKLFDGYWKTKQADATLKDQAADLDKRRKGMVDDHRKLQEDYNKLLETANDQAVSSDEREKRKKAAEAKLLEIKGIEEGVGTFDRMARTQLGEKQRAMRDKILGEIRDAINGKAKAAGYSIVLDTAAETPNLTPVIPFTDGKDDITDAVLNQLNSTAPIGALKPEEKTEPKKDK
jgi:outer membrane protein